VVDIVAHGILGPVKVALLSDCYLPRLGGIEVQVHDLAA
jgi:glycogen synthase